MKENLITSVDEYILQQSPDIQVMLQTVRETIRKEMPEVAFEKISYQMPTFDVYGNCVHFAVAKNHIGFYPAPSGIAAFEEIFKEKKYKYSKGAVQFPINKPMPIELIRVLTRFRIEENISKYNEKKGAAQK
ncbi:MAG: hypothetical protein K0R18_1796 [Bacillales bacterium]|nr:hypothetical protein [Bacillales bacterium]